MGIHRIGFPNTVVIRSPAACWLAKVDPTVTSLCGVFRTQLIIGLFAYEADLIRLG